VTTTFPTDNRSILNENDAVTGWTATKAPTLFTTAPSPIEATGSLGYNVSNTSQDSYITITSDDWTNGTVSVWMRPFGTMGTTAGGGVGIQVGDGTNRIAYHVGGSDTSAFRHEAGPIEWACYVLDLGNKPANFTALAGSEASLTESAITQVGIYFTTISKSVGNVENCFVDIMRWANPGEDVVMLGGTTSGAAGNGEEAAAVDRDTADQTAYGVIRELATGVYGIQNSLTIGDSTSSSDQYWAESNVTYAWEDRGLSSTNYYRFAIIGSSTATNCEVSFSACTFSVPSTTSASFDGNGADLTVCDISSSTFIGFDQGIETSDDTGDDWTLNTYIGNDQVVFNGCDMSGSNFSEYVGAANTSILQYDLNVDPDGELDDCTFAKTSGTAHHAIEFGTAIADAADFTLRGCAFGTDFSATEDGTTGDETFHFLDTTGTITLNLVGCTGNFGYRSEGVVVSIVADPATTKVTVQDADGTLIENARVFLETADNGGGSGLPYEAATSSLTQAAGVATLTASAVHGLVTNDKVVVRGAAEEPYNSVVTITVTSTTVFTYAIDSGATTPAGGTPIFSYVPIHGLSSALGVIQSSRVWPASQGLQGYARKSSSSPYFKQTAISITDAAGGTDLLVTLQSDE
jgi:hypothetical protein